MHQAAREADGTVRVVYVDNDPGMVAHGRALLGDNDNATVIVGDLRRPEQILDSAEVRKLPDPGHPVALTLLGVLHHISAHREFAAAVTARTR